MMHSAENRQKMNSKGILGINIIEIAVKKAAEPSIKDETFVMLPFSLMLLPISIAITVPMMLYGPPMQFPIRNMATQYCQGSLVSANETMNMITELKRSNGLKISALFSQRSTKKPTAVPPIKLPISIMLEIYPFWDCKSPPLLSKKMGNQKRRPQMQPLRQEYPRTQRGTLGRQITEKIPYFKVQCGYYWLLFGGPLQVLIATCFGSSSESIDSLQSLTTQSTFISSSGFYFKKKNIRDATTNAKAPVRRKLYIQEMPLFCNRLQRLEAIMLPTFAFIAHIPINTPFLFFENQLPKIPIIPGQPVAWKNPLKHIKMVIRIGLQNDVRPQIIGKSIQLQLASTNPTMIYVLSETR